MPKMHHFSIGDKFFKLGFKNVSKSKSIHRGETVIIARIFLRKLQKNCLLEKEVYGILKYNIFHLDSV